jgi:hypothetical protein
MTSSYLSGKLFTRPGRRGGILDGGADFGQSGAKIFRALPVKALLVRPKVRNPILDLGLDFACDHPACDLARDLDA